MQKNTAILLIILALIIGHAAGYYVGTNNPHDRNMSQDVPAKTDGTMEDTMSGMTSGLEGKTGDKFDKAFITGMIVHHEGAVAMAQSALQNAKHEEIKKMAQAIITAQTNEITQMKAWLKAWYGIEAVDGAHHMEQ
ncbi:MAG: DUF305 domain-containing protein [Patescibacteria group bacterium]